jgi:hypothetical protein
MFSMVAKIVAHCLVLSTALFLGAASAAAGQVTSTPSSSLLNERVFTGDGFEGTFLQLTVAHRAWSQQQWRAELDNLRKLGFDTLVLQWSVYDGVSFIDDEGTDTSTVERILAAADDVRLDCYLGLSLRGSWWKPHEVTDEFLQNELSENIDTARRLYSRVEHFRSFQGWYIPHEMTDLISSDDQRESIIQFFSRLTENLKKLNPLKSILASGYTDPHQANLVRFVLRWSEFLEQAGIDVLIFQDGAGARGKDWRAILPFVEAVAILDESFAGDVWLVAEAFDQIHGPPVDDQSFEARPASMERIREQLDALRPFRRKLMVFSYFDYMRPGVSENTTQLFDAYRQLIEKKVTE